jgi:hypothetical protein
MFARAVAAYRQRISHAVGDRNQTRDLEVKQ